MAELKFGPTYGRSSDQRNWMLFTIASYVGCNAAKSDCGAMKTMKIIEPSDCCTVTSQSRSGCASPFASGNGEAERRDALYGAALASRDPAREGPRDARPRAGL